MEETILIKSQSYKIKRPVIAILLILFVAWFLFNSAFSSQGISEEQFRLERNLREHEQYYEQHKSNCDDTLCERCLELERRVEYSKTRISEFNPIVYSLREFGDEFFYVRHVPFWTHVGLVSITLISWVVTWWLKSYELTVTDKRAYGKVAFGKRVDLPYDSIAAISTFGLVKGVSVATASGFIRFLLVKNADEVYEVLNRLLMERQESKKTTLVKEVVAAPGNAAELKQYKELLDEGVISQEEFDAKKKQLLGL